MAGKGLRLGAAISGGAQSFVDSFMQARMLDQQQKLQKHQIILQALYHNLQDENLPYAQRAKIFDSIPGLIGVKTDVPLSQMMGLQDLLDDEVETQSGVSATPEKKGTPASTITDERVQNQVSAEGTQLAGTINQEATQDVPAGIGRPQITEKMGDLSPAKYKQLIINRQQDIDSQRALEQYRRKAEIDFDLQQQSYKAQGYNKVVTEGFNSNGEYVVLMANASNDVKEVKMPKGFQPTKVLAKSSSGLPAAVRAYVGYFQGQTNPLTGNPYTPEEAQAEAFKLYKERGDVFDELRKKQIETTTQGGQLRNTGEMPRTQAEIEADKDRDAAREDRKEDRVFEAERIATESAAKLADVRVTEARAKAAYDEAQSAFNAWVVSNGSKEGEQGIVGKLMGSKPDYTGQTKIKVDGVNYYVDPSDLADDEVKVLRNNLDARRKELEAIETQKRTYEGTLKAQEQRIRNLNSRKAASGASNNGTVTISPTQIQIFRKNNANNAKVRAMTDEDIRQILMRNRNRWQP